MSINKMNELIKKTSSSKNPNESKLFCLDAMMIFDKTLFFLNKNGEPVDVEILFDVLPEHKLYLSKAKFKGEEGNMRKYAFGQTEYLIWRQDWERFDNWKTEFLQSL